MPGGRVGGVAARPPPRAPPAVALGCRCCLCPRLRRPPPPSGDSGTDSPRSQCHGRRRRQLGRRPWPTAPAGSRARLRRTAAAREGRLRRSLAPRGCAGQGMQAGGSPPDGGPAVGGWVARQAAPHSARLSIIVSFFCRPRFSSFPRLLRPVRRRCDARPTRIAGGSEVLRRRVRRFRPNSGRGNDDGMRDVAGGWPPADAGRDSPRER
jgi:hypothetical protein